jgi:hypothetical protein
METRRIAAEYRLTHWAGVMSERQESGLSIRAFCENAGIHENTYFYWQRRLREATCDSMPEIGLVPSGFMEVKLAKPAAIPPSAATSSSHISIEGSGVRIMAGCEYPADKLVALLREVVRSC